MVNNFVSQIVQDSKMTFEEKLLKSRTVPEIPTLLNLIQQHPDKTLRVLYSLIRRKSFDRFVKLWNLVDKLTLEGIIRNDPIGARTLANSRDFNRLISLSYVSAPSIESHRTRRTNTDFRCVRKDGEKPQKFLARCLRTNDFDSWAEFSNDYLIETNILLTTYEKQFTILTMSVKSMSILFDQWLVSPISYIATCGENAFVKDPVLMVADSIHKSRISPRDSLLEIIGECHTKNLILEAVMNSNDISTDKEERERLIIDVLSRMYKEKDLDVLVVIAKRSPKTIIRMIQRNHISKDFHDKLFNIAIRTDPSLWQLVIHQRFRLDTESIEMLKDKEIVLEKVIKKERFAHITDDAKSYDRKIATSVKRTLSTRKYLKKR